VPLKNSGIFASFKSLSDKLGQFGDAAATERLSADFRIFNEQVGLPVSSLTNMPASLTPHQIAIGGYRGKDLLINKANKLGATWTILRKMEQLGTVPDMPDSCVGFNMMLTSSRGELAMENMLRLQRDFELPALAPLVQEKKATRLVLKNGTRYLTAPASPAAMRSWERLKFIFADEAAHIGRLDDSEYVGAMTGRLANTNGYFWICSTPKGQRGFFHRLAVAARDQKISMKYMELNYLVGIGTFFTDEYIEKERQRLGNLFAQEYECKFLSAENAAIEQTLIEQSQVLDHVEEW
jgi:hypothetical protein